MYDVIQNMRRRRESNSRIVVLQTTALPLGYCAIPTNFKNPYYIAITLQLPYPCMRKHELLRLKPTINIIQIKQQKIKTIDYAHLLIKPFQHQQHF